MNKVLISLYDLTGNASQPYRDAGWKVFQIDEQLGQDILTWDYMEPLRDHLHNGGGKLVVGIIAMQPCTCYANSGNRHMVKRMLSGTFDFHQKLVARTYEVINYYHANGCLKFWQLENPMTDIHKKNLWIGEIKLRFDPCDFAGYATEPDKERYNKQTWLFGKFKPLKKKRLEPLDKDSPVWKNYGGSSLKTKNARSITPQGFSRAFYEANH